jgi:hypothetical protein
MPFSSGTRQQRISAATRASRASQIDSRDGIQSMAVTQAENPFAARHQQTGVLAVRT